MTGRFVDCAIPGFRPSDVGGGHLLCLQQTCSQYLACLSLTIMRKECLEHVRMVDFMICRDAVGGSFIYIVTRRSAHR